MSSSGASLNALPRVSVEVMESLYQHRVLSSPQINRMHTPGKGGNWTRKVLADLRSAGLLDCASGGLDGRLWFLTAQGQDAVETIPSRGEQRRRQVTPAQAAGPLRAHTHAVNEAGLAFMLAARERSDDCSALAWRHEVAHSIAPRQGRHTELVIADAVLRYTEQQQDGRLDTHEVFIELDRATVPAAEITAKLLRYERLRTYRPSGPGHSGRRFGWQEHYASFPTIVILFAHRAREQLLARLQTVVANVGVVPRLRELPILLGLLEDLISRGPFAPIFIDPHEPSRYVNWLHETSGAKEDA